MDLITGILSNVFAQLILLAIPIMILYFKRLKTKIKKRWQIKMFAYKWFWEYMREENKKIWAEFREELKEIWKWRK